LRESGFQYVVRRLSKAQSLLGTLTFSATRPTACPEQSRRVSIQAMQTSHGITGMLRIVLWDTPRKKARAVKPGAAALKLSQASSQSRLECIKAAFCERDVSKGLSCVPGNWPAQFLGGLEPEMAPGYPTTRTWIPTWTAEMSPASNRTRPMAQPFRALPVGGLCSAHHSSWRTMPPRALASLTGDEGTCSRYQRSRFKGDDWRFQASSYPPAC